MVVLRGVDGEPHVRDDARSRDLSYGPRLSRPDWILAASVVVSARQIRRRDALLGVTPCDLPATTDPAPESCRLTKGKAPRKIEAKKRSAADF